MRQHRQETTLPHGDDTSSADDYDEDLKDRLRLLTTNSAASSYVSKFTTLSNAEAQAATSVYMITETGGPKAVLERENLAKTIGAHLIWIHKRHHQRGSRFLPDVPRALAAGPHSP